MPQQLSSSRNPSVAGYEFVARGKCFVAVGVLAGFVVESSASRQIVIRVARGISAPIRARMQAMQVGPSTDKN
jgi:hypothetical protein